MRHLSGSLILVIFIAFTACAQTQPAADETQARVPELESYHEFIYPLWHTAWPAKDVAAMSALLPNLEQGAAKVAAAQLPGILRDKKPAWDAGVAKLNESVIEYKAAVEAGDTLRLLKAAEQLHARYEGLVRVIRPPMKEIDAFHTDLYPLYHYYWPEYNLPKIKESAVALEKKMALLNNATLPKRHEAKGEKFDAARAKLTAAVADLQSAADLEDGEAQKEAVKKAVTSVHSSYLILEKVFE